MKKVYLAGRVGGEKWKVAPKLIGAEWVASDGGNHSEHLWGVCVYDFDSDHLRENLESCFVDKLRSCVGLVAYLYDTESYGSIAEIAYAAAMGKPCFVIVRRHPKTDDGYDGMFNAYWFVSHLPGVKAYEIYCNCMAGPVFDKILSHLGIQKAK